MYIVLWKQNQPRPFSIATGYEEETFDTLEKAKREAINLYKNGKRDIKIVQELPITFTVDVEI